MNKNILIGLGFLMLVGSMIYFGVRLLSNKPRDDQSNPYKYNLEAYEQVDSTLYNYKESRQIKINAIKLYALAIDNANKLYVTADQKLFVFDSTGQPAQTILLSQPARSIAVDENGDIYLAMLKMVFVFDKDGQKQAEWSELDGKAHFTAIAVSTEDVFVADAGNRIVWRFNKSGKLLNRIGAKDTTRNIPGFIVPSPYLDLLIGRDESLWAVNPGRYLIQNYTANGDLRSSWGQPSMTVDGFSGCCNPTHIAMLTDGSFVTSEKGLVRIKIYNQQGEFQTLVAGKETFGEDAVGLDLAVDSKNNIYILDPKAQIVRVFSKI